MSYSRYLTARSLARNPSPIRALTAIQAQAGKEMISLAAGAPNSNLFPFESISITLKDQAKTNHILKGPELNAALQYSPTIGYAPLRAHFSNIQKAYHNFNEDLHDIVITPGSQDGLMKILVAMVNRNDKVLIDHPAYSGTLAILQPMGAQLVGINTDKNGMNIDDLEKQLKKGNKGEGAKLLITVPNGSNPTGASLSLERKLRLLEIADHYDLFIIEDDPYYWLTYDKEDKVPSLFCLENRKFLENGTDSDYRNTENNYRKTAPAGRVLRSDSLSKTISSGIRIGWQTGPKQLIDRVVKHQEASSMHTSTLSQAIVSALFDQWAKNNLENPNDGTVGFVDHCGGVVDFYVDRCAAIHESCERHLGDIASWDKPTAGMFLWVKINGISDTRNLIKDEALKNNVLAVDGQSFSPNDEKSCYVRLSFSQETPERMDEAVKRLGNLIRKELKNAQ